MSSPTSTPMPRCALCCPRWAVLVPRHSFLSVSSTLLDPRFSVTRKYRSRYALQGDLTLVVRHCWLAIGFYLGSDTLRRYTLGELATSFAKHQYYPRGRRLVLYDAEGDFNRNFDWWRKDSSSHRFIEPQLPFESGRTDLLTGSGSRLDIQNINLLATLLVHAQCQGYWSQLGMQFEE